MTINEKIEMYKEKKGFIEKLSEVFTEYRPKGSTVAKIEYKVFYKAISKDSSFQEWIIVTYNGGAFSPLNVNGNSNTANYKVIGNVLNSGDYELVDVYLDLTNQGYEEIEL